MKYLLKYPLWIVELTFTLDRILPDGICENFIDFGIWEAWCLSVFELA